MFLADIRNTCDEVGDNLATICINLSARGCLARVQHLCIAGLKSRCEGKANAFWEAVGSAILVAQRLGLHRDAVPISQADMHEDEKEMRYRTFVIYIYGIGTHGLLYCCIQLKSNIAFYRDSLTASHSCLMT